MWSHESTSFTSMMSLFSTPACSMMVLRYMFGGDDIQNVPHREWLLDFKQAIDDVRSVLKEQCRGDEFIGAKVGESTRYRTRDAGNKP